MFHGMTKPKVAIKLALMIMHAILKSSYFVHIKFVLQCCMKFSCYCYFSLKILVMLMMPSVGEMAMILTAIDYGLVIHYIILIMLMRPPGTFLIPLSVLI